MQTSLGKADTALQSIPEDYATKTDVWRITSQTISPGIASIDGQKLWVDPSSADTPPSFNFKTINGTSIIGSGNITIEGGGTNQFYITDFTVLNLQQLVNGDVTEIPVNCDALSTAIRNDQIILIPYGSLEDGYFGYSVPDVYTEDLVYMTVSECGSGIRYIIEMDSSGSILYAQNVWLASGDSNTTVINLGINFDFLEQSLDQNGTMGQF